MSFKRAGDDSGALNKQRKRRVAELLSEDIEDDELIQLKNGKFACMLCYHRPVFDSVNMFYVHKQGKKHLASMEYAAREKQDLADLITKQKHEEQCHQHVSQIQPSCPNLDVKRQKTRPFDRKKVVSLSSVDEESEPSDTVTMATKVEELPGNRRNSQFRSNNQIHTNRPVNSVNNHHSPVARSSGNAGCDDIQNKIDKKSYNVEKLNRNSKFGNKPTSSYSHPGEEVIGAKNVHKFIGSLQTEQRQKFYLSRKNQQKELASDMKKTGLLNNTNSGTSFGSLKDGTHSVSSPYQTWDYYKNLKGGHVKLFQLKKDGKTSNASSDTMSCPPTKKPSQTPEQYSNSATGVNIDKSAQAEKMLQAFGSGWKKDWRGQWVKDEEAEFDSDEEEPNI